MGYHQMLPPASSAFGPNPCTVAPGRTYGCVVGSTLLVPDFDGLTLQSNGWTIAAPGGAGTTAQRPVNSATSPLLAGTSYLDMTLGYTIIWDGKTWRNKATGAAV
jgi:hypothetical protein